ncbi:hypothetical protein AAG570_004540 [Ranatra chinensis]|uniref:Uncharacterized protein n=1 Tax=Ranatra chinensis TaxID=642074 RepID=A0ABD0YDS7_9HEMI
MEAGGRENLMSYVPRLYPFLQKTEYDWNYTTVEQKYACRESKGVCRWPSGHVLGGSSSINVMTYVRGNRKVFDSWAKAGNPGWKYEEVLPYFKKSEDQRNPTYAADTRHHGTKGHLAVSDIGYESVFGQAFVAAAKEIGLEERDINGEMQTGVMKYQGTISNGIRASTSKAFLEPVRDRKNLHIITESEATKLIFDSSGNIATGVEYTRHGKRGKVVRATKEVILSAGVIKSPQILALSGLGPKDDLDRLGIPVVKDLPVGRGLTDHSVVVLMFRVNRSSALTTPEMIRRYVHNSTGPLSSSSVVAVAFFGTPFPGSFPNAQISAFNSILSDDDVWSLAVIGVRPRSRGTLKLKSSDPRTPPQIDPNYYADESDMTTMIGALKQAFKLSRTPPLRKYNFTYDRSFHKLCSHIGDHNSDSYLRCLVVNYTQSALHGTGTCRMGSRRDPWSVVDSTLRVKGTNNLRVIDASVMPEIVNGNTAAATIMIAEKGAQYIIDFYSP